MTLCDIMPQYFRCEELTISLTTDQEEEHCLTGDLFL